MNITKRTDKKNETDIENAGLENDGEIMEIINKQNNTGERDQADEYNNTDRRVKCEESEAAEMDPYLTLRAHHLLCIPQYQGSGYSKAFCLQMDKVTKTLKERRERLVIQDAPDVLCAHCPNLVQAGSNLLHPSEEKSPDELWEGHGSAGKKGFGGWCCEKEAEIIRKDRTLLAGLSIEAGAAYDAEELREILHSQMTQNLFDEACGDCEWLRRGFCSYRLWREKFYDSF